MSPQRAFVGVGLIVVLLAHAVAAQPRVWIADQGNSAEGYGSNRILEIDPFTHNPSGPDGSDVTILNTLPSPAGAFLDELGFDDQDRMWCVVKEEADQDPDGAERIDKDTGALLNPPVGRIEPPFPGAREGGHLEGVAFDGAGLWFTSVHLDGGNNMLTRVDPETGNPIAPFDSGPLAARGYVDIPGFVCQGLLWEEGNGGYGWLWHSDVNAKKIYKLDVSLLWTNPGYDPTDENGLTVATYNVPFKPKGMDWMEEKIWVTAPYFLNFWNPSVDAGIWEFDPADGSTTKLFSTPFWNLDGLAILDQPPGPKIVLSTGAVDASVWVFSGDPPDDTFEISNGGDDTLDYDITDDADWLTVSPTSGSATTETDTITLSYEVDGFLAGVYAATVTVTGNAYNSPQTIDVTVTVDTVGPDLDGDCDVDQTDWGRLQVCFSDPVAPVPYWCSEADFDVSGLVNQDDAMVFRNCQSGTDVCADQACDD